MIRVIGRRHHRALTIGIVLVPLLSMIVAQGPAQVAATSPGCPSGLSDGARWHAIMRTRDVANNDGTGTDASWREVADTVDDYYSGGFVNAEMWNILEETPNETWVAAGFTNRLTFTNTNGQSHSCIECFFMEYGNDNATPRQYDQQYINRSISGNGAEDEYRMVWNSATTGWDTYINGRLVAGYHLGPYLQRVDIGTESTDPCSIIPTTSFGANSVPGAFQYRVGIDGIWTTWGSGARVVDGTNSRYSVAWDHFAISGHVYGGGSQ